MPHALNPLILGTNRLLLTLLCRTARQTLLPCGHQKLGGQRGATRVLHPWDQPLNAPVHRHCLGPAGALAEDGTHGVPPQPRCLFPGRALSTVCRAKFLAAFPQAYATEALDFAPEAAWCGSPPGCTPLLAQLYGQPWGGDAQRPCAGPPQVREDLGRSIHRSALANPRLLAVRDGHVRVTDRHRRQGHRVHTMPREAQAFIRRFLLHLVPPGCQRLRHGGFLATRCKARALRQCRHMLGQPTPPSPRETPNAVAWMRPQTGIAIPQCPHCGSGPLGRPPLPPRTALGSSRTAPQEVPLVDAA